jgi:hypothetical protein
LNLSYYDWEEIERDVLDLEELIQSIKKELGFKQIENRINKYIENSEGEE